jgi:hypothetical protein
VFAVNPPIEPPLAAILSGLGVSDAAPAVVVVRFIPQ